MSRILLTIPMYRCEGQISRVIKDLQSEEIRRAVEKVVIIDNRSPDNSVQVALTEIKRAGLEGFITVFQNKDNFGLGGSHKVAFNLARELKFNYVGILHGDHQAVTSEILLLIQEAEKFPLAAAILGARFAAGSNLQGYSQLREWGNRGLNAAYSILSGRRTLDMGSGLNLFKVSELNPQRYLPLSDAFTFNMGLLLDYYSRRSELRFVPITWREEDQISNAKTFKVGFIALKTVLAWRVGQVPKFKVVREYLSEPIAKADR